VKEPDSCPGYVDVFCPENLCQNRHRIRSVSQPGNFGSCKYGGASRKPGSGLGRAGSVEWPQTLGADTSTCSWIIELAEMSRWLLRPN
jgi:hypothetical protein